MLLKKANLGAILSFSALVFLSGCNCKLNNTVLDKGMPAPFKPQGYVHAEMMRYPTGHPVNSFYEQFLRQQKELEEYYYKSY